MRIKIGDCIRPLTAHLWAGRTAWTRYDGKTLQQAATTTQVAGRPGRAGDDVTA